ncbi:MAG: hypothetical protein NT058_00060 [Candidatus Portnoybacteria bacterium]|nr:hypothetical protein [Candidatus Portnoybacteria bacterium]
MKGQCFTCMYRLFFKPEPDGTYSCCDILEETVDDIDLNSGVSPSILKHGVNGEPCVSRAFGSSICETDPNKPFDVPIVRLLGEEKLKERLGIH